MTFSDFHSDGHPVTDRASMGMAFVLTEAFQAVVNEDGLV